MSDSSEATAEVPLTETVRRRRQLRKARPKRQPRYHVILWNDEEHTYEYVILMLRELFGHQPEKGFQLAKQVDTEGRAVVLTNDPRARRTETRSDPRLRQRPRNRRL
ncbi:MAG TPA: ATP-dependent Clp protease adaptor ClpS [Thermoguttaceae bacterium]|nr:ATP-dependent Clp protease adaptor ClpS [Thermoguttaceae bacterium]